MLMQFIRGESLSPEGSGQPDPAEQSHAQYRDDAAWQAGLKHAAEGLNATDIEVPSTPDELQEALEEVIAAIESEQSVEWSEYKRLRSVIELMGWGMFHNEKDTTAQSLYTRFVDSYIPATKKNLFIRKKT